MTLEAVEAGSDEELALRATWMSRMMFNPVVGWPPEHRSYEEWLEDQGFRLG